MRLRRTVATLGVLAVGATALAAGAPPAGAAVPTITVSPGTTLLDEHRVTVTMAGLTPDEDYVVVECAGDDCAPPRVYLESGEPSGGGLARAPERAVTADAGGSAVVVTDMWRVIGVGDDEGVESVDCSVTACDVAVVQASDRAVVARTPVTFASTGTYQWPQATIAVAVPERLAHLGAVHVTGSGFDHLHAVREAIPGQPPYEWPTRRGARAQVCTEPGPGEWGVCQTIPDLWVAVAADGTVDAEVHVPRFVDAGGLWDCAEDPCRLKLTQRGDNPLSNGAGLDFGPEWSPFATAAAMVDAFMGALHVPEPAPGDRQVLIDDLEDGDIDAATVLQAIAHAPHPGLDVASLYGAILGRRPDAAGMQFWTAQRLAGTSAGRIAERFAATPEVRTWSEVGTPTTVATEAYRRILGRDPAIDERDYWAGRITAGMPRHRMVASFARTPEARIRFFHRGAFASAFVGLIGRTPSASGWNLAGLSGDWRHALYWPIVGSPEVAARATG